MTGRSLALLATLLCASSVASPAAAQRQPALRLSGVGRVTAIVQNNVRDGFDQRINYDGGDGRNLAEIALRNQTGDLLLAFPPRLAKPSEVGIASELATRFPGEDMRVVPGQRHNRYGPIGVAVGRDCLYAWQWFQSSARDQDRDPSNRLFPYDPRYTDARRALSIRIRLCRGGQTSLASLLHAVETLTIALPTGDGGYVASGAPQRPRRTAPSPRKAQAARPVTRPPQPEVPPPATAAPPPPAAVPRSEIGPDGRRYIGPVSPSSDPTQPAGPRDTTIPRPSDAPRLPSSGPSGSPGGRSRDLPPEAYTPPN